MKARENWVNGTNGRRGGADAPDDGPATRLWGGRFAAGPADALARLSVSVQFDWRLARYDLRASRAHARVLHRADLLTDDELAAMLKALDDLDRSTAAGTFRPTGTCTPHLGAGCSNGSARSAASCGPAGAGTIRWLPTCGFTCGITYGSSPAGSPSWNPR